MTASQEIGPGGRAHPYRLGARVRIVDTERLEAALYDPAAQRRPTPAQCRAAGQAARVVGVLLDGGAPRYRLAGHADLWPGEWLEPAEG